MLWTPQQDRALKRVSAWLRDKNGPQVFRLFGFAGTGKTTMARELSKDVDGPVFFGAYTGKAAHVLRQKGCPGASTLHALAYTTKDRAQTRFRELESQLADLLMELGQQGRDMGLSDERLGEWINSQPKVKELRTDIEKEQANMKRPVFQINPESVLKTAKLLVIDECSMVDGQMGEDILEFGMKVLVLGDPAQLPPVMGGGFFTEHEPDFMLTDIMRQAKDNPIIELATRVRNQEVLRPGRYGSSKVVGRVDPSDALRAGQILVGRNRTRHSSNLRMRALLGRTEELPMEGDRLVCLRNNHELGLLNGALWKTVRSEEADDRLLMLVEPIDGDENLCQEMVVHKLPLLGREKELPWWERKEAQEFAYGYALTVHKAQGSQWDDVLLFDEGAAFGDVWWRWLYTGITRAAETVTVVA